MNTLYFLKSLAKLLPQLVVLGTSTPCISDSATLTSNTDHIYNLI